MIHRKPNHEIVADYWYKEIAVGQRIIDTATKQLGKIANENQLQIDYTPSVPDTVIYVNFRKDDPGPIAA